MKEKSLIREAWDMLSVPVFMVTAIITICLAYSLRSQAISELAEVVAPQSSVEWIQAYTAWAEAEGGTAFVGEQQVEDELLPLVLAWCDAHLEPEYTPIRYIQYEGLWFTEIMGISQEGPRDEGGELWCLVFALDKQGKWSIASTWREDTYTALEARGEGE